MEETREIQVDRQEVYKRISDDFYDGKMPMSAYRFIDKAMDDMKIPNGDVYILFGRAMVEKKLYDFTWFEECAKELYSDLQDEEATDYDLLIQRVADNVAKVVKKPLDKEDLETIKLWVDTLEYDEHMIEYACLCNQYLRNVTLDDIFSKLLAWDSEDIDTPEEAKEYEAALFLMRMKNVYKLRYGKDITLNISIT